MTKKKRDDDGDPKPLNFDRDEELGIPEPFQTPEDNRGDDENEQYYEEEEAMSKEEAKKRKEEGNL